MAYRINKGSIWILTGISIVIFCCYAGEARAHGVNYHIANGSAVSIAVSYDTGEPMSYSDVKLFSPSDPELEYQNGRTDKNGCFAFVPDESGTWRISVDDGMAHGIHTTFQVGEAMTVEAHSDDFPRWLGIVSGLCVILGISSMVMCIRYKIKEKGRPRI